MSPVQPRRHVGLGDVKIGGHGRRRKVFDVPQQDDFPVRLGKSIDRLEQDAHQLAAVFVGLGIRAIRNRRHPSAGRNIGVVLRGQRNVPAPPRRLVQCFVPYDLTDPGARRRPASVPADPSEHGDPAFLQGVLRRRVVACHATREWQEPGRATPNPFFVTTVEERALDGVFQSRQRRPRSAFGGRVGHLGCVGFYNRTRLESLEASGDGGHWRGGVAAQRKSRLSAGGGRLGRRRPERVGHVDDHRLGLDLPAHPHAVVRAPLHGLAEMQSRRPPTRCRSEWQLNV